MKVISLNKYLLIFFSVLLTAYCKTVYKMNNLITSTPSYVFADYKIVFVSAEVIGSRPVPAEVIGSRPVPAEVIGSRPVPVEEQNQGTTPKIDPRDIFNAGSNSCPIGKKRFGNYCI